MKLKFNINPDYIFLHALNMAQRQEPFSGWAQFTNKIWEESPEVFYFLAGSPEYILYSKKRNFSFLLKKAEKVMREIKKSKEHKRLIQETKEYTLFTQKQWQKNKEKVLSFFESVVGMKLPKKIINVFLTHPKLNNGMTLDDNMIVLGHKEDWKNYTTVYLCHELMHIFTNHDSSETTHAVIELITDNELRIHLNGKGVYFKESNNPVGHKSLQKLEKKILPSWKIYLKKKDKNIFKFLEEIKKID